jgi:hypothetical protein
MTLSKEQIRAMINKYEELTGDRLPDGDGFDEVIVSEMFKAALSIDNN